MISPPVPLAPVATTTPPASVAPGRARWARGLGGAVVAGASIVALRAAGGLDGIVGLLVAAALLLALPTSGLLSRRILFTTVIAVGWVPLLWWVDLPVGDVGRVTILLALVAAALAGWMLSGRPAERFRRILPRVGWADLAVLPAALAAAVMASPWLRATNPRGALAMLMSGWDHSAHYNMTAMIRTQGVMVWAAVPPPGTRWSYAHYPEGSHAAGAAIMELLRAGPVGAPAEEVVLYARSLGLLSVAVVILVAAGVAAVPTLRRRPVVAATVIGVLTAAFSWGPAGLLVAEGFPNFMLACALVGAIPLAVGASGRWTAPVPLLVLGGALVGIAHSWALALTMALPMCLALLWPLRRRRAAAGANVWGVDAVIVAATAAASVVAVLVIRVQPLAEIVVLGGGVTSRSLAETVLTALVFLVAVGVLAITSRRYRPADVSRVLVLAIGPLTGIAVAAWIAYVQLEAGGLSYYFWKYALALEVLVFVVGGIAAGMVVARSAALGTTGRSAGLGLVALAATLVALGSPHPLVTDVVPLRESAGMGGRTGLIAEYVAPSPETARLLAAAELGRTLPGPSVYVPIDPTGPFGAASAGHWYVALTGQWTERADVPITMLLSAELSGPRSWVVVDEILEGDPGLTVIVPPPWAEQVRSRLPGTSGERVVTW